MSTIKSLWQFMFSPRLYKVHADGPAERLYEPGGLERWGDQILHSFYLMWNFSVYTSPVLALFLYKKGYLAAEGIITFTKLATGIGLVLVVSYCMRGIGRANNTHYRNFLHSYRNAIANYSDEAKTDIRKYDFDFNAWPIDFKSSDVEGDDSKLRKSLPAPSLRNRTAAQWVSSLPCQIIAYLAVHSFGLRLIYPGSVVLIQFLMSSILLQGRSTLVTQHNGIRYKLHTRDGNDIDTMYINNRKKSPNGDILVICSEGNAGFYEIGIMRTPITAGFSVLGWNHPGFCGSSGRPYPSEDQNAMDVVMQFAIYKLGYLPENILLFGWSIGGYSTSWAAMNYPDVKGVVLDATFDDVLALAVIRMPQAWAGIVRLAIREYVNLNIVEQLYQYPGPMLLIRRTEDEIICTEDANLSSNRGNHLLVKILKYRFPKIFGIDQLELLNEYLAAHSHSQLRLVQQVGINDEVCNSILSSYAAEHSKSYPMNVGEKLDNKQKNEIALFLAQRYMRDYGSTHCTELPPEYLQVPWDITLEADYVFT